MFFALTEEQSALEETVRDYLGDRFALDRVREVFEDPDGDGHPAELWKAMGEQGWLAVLVPEEHDGLGLGLVDAQVLARAFGAWATPGPWRGTVLAAEAIRLAGSPEQQAEWLPKLASGEAVGAVQLDSPWVEYGAVADVLVAEQDGGLVLAPRGGFDATNVEQLDLTTRLSRVTVRDSAPLPGGPSAAGELRDRAALLAAADLAGIARETVDRTASYDTDRIQFGKPVGSFQAIKHHLADLHVGAAMSIHAVLYAAHALDAGLPDARAAVSVAKAKASDTAVATTGAMIQYFGGIGFTWEHDAHFYWKRAKRLARTYGDAAQHRERLAATLLG
ncbi:MAG TPA: acyl-CoA dehydrogenase family protein [Mycobacteriales bacterium]|nr:acyl-CoA dehydrogenase family protein [Mycobacteriales bacterium]